MNASAPVKRSKLIHTQPQVNRIAPPIDASFKRLTDDELLLRVPSTPVMTTPPKSNALSVDIDDWHYGYLLGHTKLACEHEGSVSTFTIECVDDGEWFGTDRRGNAKRFSASQFFKLAIWDKTWFYHSSSWYFNWAQHTPYKNANWRDSMLEYLTFKSIIIPHTWILSDADARRLRHFGPSLSPAEQVDAAMIQSTSMNLRNDGLKFLWYAATQFALSPLWDDKLIAAYLIHLESERCNASCLKRACSAVTFLQKFQNSPRMSYFSFTAVKAVRNELLKKHKTCPQTPLEIEAWMVRDVLKVYVWHSTELWSIIFGNGFAVCYKLWMRHDCLSRLRMDSTYLEIIEQEERAILYLNGCKNRQFQGCWCDLARVPEDREGSYDALLKTKDIYPNGFLMPHMYVRGNEVIIDASKPMSRETFVAFTREALFCIGIEREICNQFSARSFRRGAASHATVQKLSQSEIAMASRTKSPNWITWYDSKTKVKRVRVSQRMGV